MTRVLITRALTVRQRDLAQRLQLDVVEAPTIHIVFSVAWPDVTMILHDAPAVDAWVYTSANGVEGMRRYLESGEPFSLPDIHFALGAKTASTLKRILPADAEIILPKSANASAMAEEIVERRLKHILHWCGNMRRIELSAGLAEKDVRLTEIIAYCTERTTIQVNWGDVQGILACSPSQIEALGALPDNINPVFFAIGPTTAEAIRLAFHQKSLTPAAPSVEELLELAAAYFNH